ncbi:MAG: hypothetical protein B7C24_01000 [Bacteroidetes bacterium 4572_77]|nr:MAG: hypothetical protein B7C24_01000 [Bacteroidetes bacterium 4572_77]
MTSYYLKTLVFFLALFINLPLNYAQNQEIEKKKHYPSVSANYGYGQILPTTDFVKGDNLMGAPMDNFQSFTLKVLWQNPGYKPWQQIYKGPYYGFGISLGDFFNPKEVGYPISYYGILGIPIQQWKKLELYAEFQFGFTQNWVHYDSITNPKNVVIGAGHTVHLNIGINAFYPLSKHIDLGAGLSFIHFSNGGMERPNRGFNIYSPSVELKYHINSRPNTRAIKEAKKINRTHDLLLMIGYGNHQLVEHEFDTNYYAIGGLSAIYFNRLSNAFRLGAGVDVNYWWGLNARQDGTIGPRTLENFTIGLLLQPEMIIDRLSLVGGIGIYARHLNYGNFHQTYQRLGVRYDVYKNWSVGINVRAVNFMLAEFMEFNMAYVFKWNKQKTK